MPRVTDREGNGYEVTERTWHHIRTFHPEFADVSDIEWVLQDPAVVVRSNWEPDTVLCYRRKRHLYRVVVVHTAEMRVKTALTASRIKEGEVLWINPNVLR